MKNKEGDKVVNLNARRAIEFAPTLEIDKRARGIQCLINIIEPDPEFQPVISDEAYIYPDACGLEIKEIKRRLAVYFGDDTDFLFEIPLWKCVDELQQRFPQWLED